jgi:hypothetical protein
LATTDNRDAETNILITTDASNAQTNILTTTHASQGKTNIVMPSNVKPTVWPPQKTKMLKPTKHN